jgi:NAD(P)-dependent dehydrogenase (short-subunit alcohol dehydrogenase family)
MTRRDEDTVHKQRRLQQAQRGNDERDAAQKRSRDKPQARGEKTSAPSKGGVQAGPREQPSHMPSQTLDKPGEEGDLALAPHYLAPDYRGSGKLEGLAALVTGGDSGIGRAVAVLFAREGADVAIAYLSSDEDAQVTVKHVEAEGRRGLALRADVKDPAACRDAVERTLKAFGKLDILVNNAAFQLHAGDIEDITDERLDETLSTNVKGYFQMARAAVPHLKRGGCIINTGSVTGLEGSRHLLDYSTTKGAIHAFTKSLASNLLPRGIRVNAVAPGPVWTPLNPADQTPAQIAKFGADTDMARPAQPEELSPAYVFLASPVCSSYITGIVLPVTGSVGAA